MNIYIVVAIVSASILIIYYNVIQKLKYWERRGIPTVGIKVPIFGNMWPILSFQKSVGEIVKEIYDSTPNFSMVGVYNFGTPELLIRDPDLIKIIFQTSFNSFQKTGIVIDPKKDPLLGKNPFFNDGEAWKKERSVLTNSMSIAKVRNMAVGVNEVCAKFHEYLKQQAELYKSSYEVKTEELFARFTSEVVAKVGFGIDGNSFTNDPGSFLTIARIVFKPVGFPAYKQLLIQHFPLLATLADARFVPVKIDNYFRSVVREVIETRRRTGTRGNDFIQQINDSYKSESSEIDDTFMTGHALSFLIDGYLTSSYTLSAIAYDLAGHPEIQEKLRVEVKEVLRNHEQKVTYEAVQDMKYMDLIIQESMRLAPTLIILSRICTEQIKLIGSDGLECLVQPGDKVILCPYGMQKDSKYWENPDKYDPERFREESKDDVRKYIFQPFGVGPRICVGMKMAMLQMKGALATLLDNYSIEPSSKTKVPFTYDIASIFHVISGGRWVKIKPLS